MDNTIGPTEGLWRSVFYDRQARQGRRLHAAGGISELKAVFETSATDDEPHKLSVNRHDDTPPQKRTAKGDEDAKSRSAGTFYGWLVVKCEDAENMGRKAEYSPNKHSDTHADIVIPEDDLRIRATMTTCTTASSPIRHGRT